MIPLGPFLLGNPLGSGGMGTVWGGLHRDEGVPVAIKVMTGELAREPAFLGAFRNEVRAVAGLDHPGIVRVFDFGQIGPETEARSRGLLPAGSPYLVMEMAGAGSLSPYCGRLPWRLARDVLLALLDALAHAHARGVIHRDLKPGNVLTRHDAHAPGSHVGGEGWRPITTFGRSLVVTDWGLAHAVERDQSGRSDEIISGTPAYMAPEQFEGRWRDTGPWTDLYALGCLAWSLVCGGPPYGRPAPVQAMAAHLYAPVPPLEAKVSVPPAFEEWVRRLLEKDPSNRWRRAADAAWALSLLEEPPQPEAPGDLPREVTAEEARASAPDTVPLLDFTPTALAPEPPPTPFSPARSARAAARTRLPLPPYPQEWHDAEEELAPPRHLVGAGLGIFGLRSMPVVDRETERNLLWRALGRVRATGGPAVALLQGPSGCGKSRLAEWLCQRAHEVGAASALRATHAQAPGLGDGLVPMVSRLLRCGGLGRAEVRMRLRGLLEGVPDANEEAEALTELLVPATRGSPGAVRLESTAERHALVLRAVARLCEERPVVLWLDDVACSADSLEFATHLWEAGEAHPLPVMLLLTARDDVLAERPAEADRIEALVRRANGLRLPVGPLAAPDHAALVRRLLGLDGELAARVEARTAGNPLFAVQLVGDWVQRGLLEPGMRGFRLRADARVDIPDDLHAVWATRLERLLEGRPDEEGWALEVASLLGQEVEGAEWAVACDRAGTPAPWGLVEALLGARLATPDEDGPVVRWSFVHGMLRESLVRRAQEGGRLQRWHRACAEMLARQGGPGIAERRARHLVAAGAADAAIDPFLVGVRERIDSGDYGLAEKLLDEREEAMEAVSLPAGDPRWGDGWLAGCWIASQRGHYDTALEYARQAEAAGARHGWDRIRARAVLEQCHVLRNRGELAEADQRLVEFGELVREQDDDDELVARLALAAGLVARDRGDVVAGARALEDALAWFLEMGNDREAGVTCNALSSLHRKSGRLSEAARYAEEARRRFEASGFRLGVADALTNLGEIARLQGDHRLAEQCYRGALARSRSLGSGNAAFPLVNLGLVLLEQWRWDESVGPLEEGLRILSGQRRRPFVAAVHACLMACAAGRRDWEAFERHLGEAGPLLAETGFVDLDVGRATRMAGDLCCDARQWAHARAALELALVQWRALGLHEDEADVARQLAELPT
ncbi:MAG: serine/threonine-protein kinase PknK [Myxococcota bacterium]